MGERFTQIPSNGKQVSLVRRAIEPALEHVTPYLPDPYRSFLCPTGCGT